LIRNSWKMRRDENTGKYEAELSDDLVKVVSGHKKRMARRVFSFEEYDELTSSLMTNTKLSEDQEKLFEKLSLVASALVKYPRAKTVKVVCRIMNCSPPTAGKWISNAINFFGDVDAVSSKGKRFLIEQRLWKMLDAADMDQQIRIMKILTDVSGVKNIEEGKNRLKRRVRVLRTTDPKVLEATETEEYE